MDLMQSLSNSSNLLVKMEKNSQIHMESQAALNSQHSLEKGQQSLRTCTSDIRTYYEAVVIKIVRHWHEDRYRDQRNTSLAN